MSGLYIHIPFCVRRCPYCDFAVSVQSRVVARERYVEALQTELRAQLCQYAATPAETIETIFCGGGTPTTLEPRVLNGILEQVRECADVVPDVEITLEANPEHLSLGMLEELRAGGWNRLSLGAQSLDDEVLRTLGRVHSGADVGAAVERAREAGFTNVSLDLIYAVPGQALEQWENTLRRAVAMGVPHISAYSLTVEPGTHFGLLQRRGELTVVPDDEQAGAMEVARAVLGAAGLERYEVSNYALAGLESRHNRGYWRGGNYLGVGCGAHSHRDGRRWWNERNWVEYARRVELEGGAVAGSEELSGPERLSEIVALGLRSVEGFHLAAASAKLGFDVEQVLAPGLQRLRAQGWLQLEEGSVRPKAHGLAVADALAVQLLNA